MPNPDRMTFHLRSSGGNYGGAEWIAADGVITSETARDLENFLKGHGYNENPGGWSVRFNSPGGDLAGGIQLGNAIRRMKLDTEVGSTEPDGHVWKRALGRCASAASFAFLGGITRSVDAGELGVHQFYHEISLRDPAAKIFSSLDFSNQQLVSALLIDYAFQMGVDPRFVSMAAGTPPNEMLFLGDRELNELNVRWFPKELGGWLIEPSGTGVIAVTTSKDATRTVTFAYLGGHHSRLTVEDRASDIEPSWLNSALDAVEGVVAFDRRLPKDALKASVLNNVLKVEFALPDVDGKTIAASRWSGVTVNGPRYMWGAFTYEIPRENAERAIGVSMRNPM
ncbi:hypothetical protein [Bradyrhizobium sp. CCBAU 11386]|uniref:COG3904 family protein n=1 Tax=Bradyrhizobium sp. CCBAU 11386 TaxID=1630837 RepID=UPI0023032A8A|nr:hypothetical protein [Bradyrhizobium sp. CCBAU 11386]